MNEKDFVNKQFHLPRIPVHHAVQVPSLRENTELWKLQVIVGFPAASFSILPYNAVKLYRTNYAYICSGLIDNHMTFFIGKPAEMIGII